MSLAATGTARGHRPAATWTTAGVLAFLGVSAAAGGVAMLSGYAAPDAWLDAIPLIDSWVLPGLVLAAGFGAGSLLTAWGVVRRPRWRLLRPLERRTGHHWSWTATLLIGLGQLAWIGLELAYLPEMSALQAVYGATGAALAVLPLTRPVRADLRTGEPR
jgi:hypothetical protein